MVRGPLPLLRVCKEMQKKIEKLELEKVLGVGGGGGGVSKPRYEESRVLWHRHRGQVVLRRIAKGPCARSLAPPACQVDWRLRVPKV